METELIGQKDASGELLVKYFAANKNPLIIGPEKQWYFGINEIRKFLNESSDSSLSLDLEHATTSNSGGITLTTVTGILKQNFLSFAAKKTKKDPLA